MKTGFKITSIVMIVLGVQLLTPNLTNAISKLSNPTYTFVNGTFTKTLTNTTTLNAQNLFRSGVTNTNASGYKPKGNGRPKSGGSTGGRA